MRRNTNINVHRKKEAKTGGLHQKMKSVMSQADVVDTLGNMRAAKNQAQEDCDYT